MDTLGVYTITLAAMRFPAHIGVDEEERAAETEIRVDVSAEAAAQPEAFIGDEPDGAPDYAAVFRAVLRVSEEPVRLLERFAFKAACAVMAVDERLLSVNVTVTKLNPPLQAGGLQASVSFRLSREQYIRLRLGNEHAY